jgi:hypothetical protein
MKYQSFYKPPQPLPARAHVGWRNGGYRSQHVTVLDRFPSTYEEALDRWTNEGGALGPGGRVNCRTRGLGLYCGGYQLVVRFGSRP